MTEAINIQIGTETINIQAGNDTLDLTVPDNTITVQSSVDTLPFVNEDVKLRFTGIGGNTYLVFNSSTNKLELWVNGAKKAQWS